MIPLTRNSRKEKTVRKQTSGCLGEGIRGHDWMLRDKSKLVKVRERFYILIMVEVTWLYKIIKFHQWLHLILANFTICNRDVFSFLMLHPVAHTSSHVKQHVLKCYSFMKCSLQYFCKELLMNINPCSNINSHTASQSSFVISNCHN